VLQADVALLDEVEELHARGEGVAAGHADHEAEVGPDEPVLRLGGGLVGPAQLPDLGGIEGIALLGETGTSRHALLYDLGQLPLLIGGEQGDQADLVQVLTN
jgi:hypothetical protein